MFKPVNRYILIDNSAPEDSPGSIVLLPEDYKPELNRYTQVSVSAHAEDVRCDIKNGDNIIVDRSMIEEITIGATNYNIILDNYVVGIVQ